MIALTHFVFGLSLAYVFNKRLITASAFSLAPDIDITFNFLYPFTASGIMHSLMASMVATFLVYIYTEDVESAKSCLLGYVASGIGLDLLTKTGFPLLFPFSGDFGPSLFGSTALAPNLSILMLSIGLMLAKKHGMVSIDFRSNR